jgi:hypothetical protein
MQDDLERIESCRTKSNEQFYGRTQMNEVHVLVSCDCEVLGAFTGKSLVETYVACLREDERESCEARGEQRHDHELAVWTVTLDDPRLVRESVNSPENSNLNQVPVLSNEIGEILGALSDKSWLPEDKCPHCESYESWGEVWPDRRVLIDTVTLDDPDLIQDLKERIAADFGGIRELSKPAEQGRG